MWDNSKFRIRGVTYTPTYRILTFSLGASRTETHRIVLTCKNLPETQTGFFDLIKVFFPVVYDIKHMMRFCDGLYGGLDKLVMLLGVERVGTSHLAGSDSLLTCFTFMKLREIYFRGSIENYQLFKLVASELDWICRIIRRNVKLCGYRIETYPHAFLHYWFARAIWSQLGFTELSTLPPSVSFADIIHYSWRYFTRRRMHLVLVTLWLIWYNRNKLKHEDKGYTVSELVYKATIHTRTFEQYESKFLSSMRFLYNSDFAWKRPPAGFIKMNSYAAWKHNLGGSIGILQRIVRVVF
ncbi:hypothetical protein QQ045_018089 [Rhodiola kirilowii]